jgi:hypothetical protein
MKLILHIGTHKTGTTALQQFLSTNRKKLLECGVYYATPPHEAEMNNIITHLLFPDQVHLVKEFFLSHLRDATQKKAETIIASSENLYCMERFLLHMPEKKYSADPLDDERKLIRRLHSSIPRSVECHIVCYVRRPDHYLESLYNQNVKRGIQFTGSAVDFLHLIGDMLDYHRYLSLWREVFGSSSCSARVYEVAARDLFQDFMAHALGMSDISQFAQPHLRANERLSRDVLEYKRLSNADIHRSRRRLENKTYALLDREIRNPNNNHEYLSPVERMDLLAKLKPSIDRLQANFGLPPFPQFDFEAAKATWQPCPGISPEKQREIEFLYKAVQSRIGFRAERFLKEAALSLRSQLPCLAKVFQFARNSGLRKLLLVASSRLQ